MRSSGAAG